MSRNDALGPVFHRRPIGTAVEPRRSDSCAGERMVSHSRTHLCKLTGLGASTSLVRPVSRELHCRGSVCAISAGGLRALDPWPPIGRLTGQSDHVPRDTTSHENGQAIFSVGYFQHSRV